MLKWAVVKCGWWATRGGWTIEKKSALLFDTMHEANQEAARRSAYIVAFYVNDKNC
jgi:hypothetical protein